MLTPRDAWQATLGQLQLQLNRATFDTWLKGSELLAYEDGEFVIRVRHAYAKDWLEKHLHHLITQTLSTIFGRSASVSFVVHLENRQNGQPRLGPLWEHAPQETGTTNHSPARPARPTRDEFSDEQILDDDLLGEEPDAFPDYSEWDPRVNDVRRTPVPAPRMRSQFNRRFTFDSFVVGPSNAFAFAAAQRVAAMGGAHLNPVFLYGGAGLGKTHLLQAIGHVCQDAGLDVMYTTAEAFTNDLVTSIRAHSMDDFRERYRALDVLLVDDIQFLAGKTRSEEEFYHTFNAIIAHGGQVVIACNRPPRALDSLDEQLRSRFEGGLMADIQVPEIDTRLAILQAKSSAQGTRLPADVADILARHAVNSVRELEGLLTQVLARASLARQPLTVELAELVIGKHAPQSRSATRLDQVLEATASYHQLSLDDLLSKRRTKEIVRARHIAIYLAREETEASLPQIGEALGGRNHTTVLHGYQKIADEIEADDALKNELSAIRRQLRGLPQN